MWSKLRKKEEKSLKRTSDSILEFTIWISKVHSCFLCAFSIEYLEFHNQLISIFICFSYIGMCQRQKLLLGHARRGADGRSRQGSTTFQPWNFHLHALTLDFSTPDNSTVNRTFQSWIINKDFLTPRLFDHELFNPWLFNPDSSTPNFSTMNLGLKSPGLQSPMLKCSESGLLDQNISTWTIHHQVFSTMTSWTMNSGLRSPQLKLFGWWHPKASTLDFSNTEVEKVYLWLISPGWKSLGLKYPGLKCPATLIKYLNTTSEQLKMLCANAIFRLAEEKESRHLVK